MTSDLYRYLLFPVLLFSGQPAFTDQSVDQQFSFGPGWTLSGNSLKSAMATAQWFGTMDQPIAGVSDKVLTVWQWDAANARWQFFTPSMSVAEMTAYAESKGYGLLSEIGAGAGFWVNVKSDVGTVAFSGSRSGTPARLSADDLPEGWSLNSVFTATTPRNLNISSSIMPPQPGQPTVSFLTLWAWDATNAKWFFYAPSLENDNTLISYIEQKGYSDFTTAGRQLGTGVGFWVNRSGNIADTPPEIFPVGLAVASPTSVVSDAGAPKSRYAYLAEMIRDILGKKLSFKTSFQPEQLLSAMGPPQCFGPNVDYTGHPDGGGASGSLGGGDLGIWLETESAGSACAAVTLDRRMDGVSATTTTALVALGGMAVEADKAGKLPAAGTCSSLVAEMNAVGASGVTFTDASLCQASSGNEWTYTLAFSFTGIDGVSHDAWMALSHTTGSTAAKYSGKLQWSATLPSIGDGCSVADSTRLGSLAYTRTSSSEMNNVMRSGLYCGKLGSVEIATKFGSDGQLDPATTWVGDFSRFGAAYDPATLDGNFGYGWQAGKNDGSARILAVGINGATQDGEAWFGYGNDIAVSDGSIKGFYCSWSAAGSSHTLQTGYAQRQAIKYNATTGIWETVAGGSNYRYAPTNSCTYTGTGFWYDRNLDHINNESPADVTVSGSESDFLWSKPIDSATIADAITARGMVFPGF